jgi:tetratricopeptide (TPR) repeat protein
MFQETFETAWFTGAKEWRENRGAGQAVLYPVREAWGTYQAVGFKEGGTGIPLPDRQQVTEAVLIAVNKHVEREIFPQVERLKKKLKENPDDIRSRNKLALTHARYGLYDKALADFLQILKNREYSPALTNAANIYYLKGSLPEALAYYNRALEQNNNNRSALVGVARCNYDLENYGTVKQTYAKIAELDPGLAERFGYLDLRGDDEVRASAVAELSTTVVWEEEE